MNSRERLMATLNGQPVDRPAVSFYEIGAFKYDPDDPDIFNVHNDPSWRPLIELAEQRTDIIRLVGGKPVTADKQLVDQYLKVENWQQDQSKYCRTSITVGGRVMTETTRRDADTDTIWKTEHFIKDIDDLRAFVELPFEVFDYAYDIEKLETFDTEIADRGIVAFDTADPICRAADLFSMADFTIYAMTEKELFHKLLEKFAALIYPRVEAACKLHPGRLWRIFGPEYASEPYLPPALFEEYVAGYTTPVIEIIHKYNGFARIHSHGRLKNILPVIKKMGADALDPIEPPSQGDVELEYVRENYGDQLVLFGNLEITDIENMPTDQFAAKVRAALEQGTAGKARGFVLMPSAAPYGRNISKLTMANYEIMVEMIEKLG